VNGAASGVALRATGRERLKPTERPFLAKDVDAGLGCMSFVTAYPILLIVIVAYLQSFSGEAAMNVAHRVSNSPFAQAVLAGIVALACN
jgi:hypothetical protein